MKRTHCYKPEKSKSQPIPQPKSPDKTQSTAPVAPAIQAKSNEEGLAEWKAQQEKWARFGTPWMNKVPNPSGESAQPWIQRKLTLGQPGDKYEQEADRVASQVVQQINAPSLSQFNQRQFVQQEKEPEGEMQAKSLRAAIQRRQAMTDEEASADLESAINRARGGGQPLDAVLQQSMGQAMGADFSGVKVHTGPQSDQLNQSIQARAFTTGQDVFFQEGAYQPRNRGGQELIAHELAHVVQQKGPMILKSPSVTQQSDTKATVSLPGRGLNQHESIQRYTVTDDNKFNLSESGIFAVENEKYPSAIYTQDDAPMSLKGGLAWDSTGECVISDETYTRYEANISEYEGTEGPGSEQFCGQFARGLTGNLPGKPQSTSDIGEVLYDKETSPGRDDGWDNHYAAVVIKDGGDHATFETAVGIEEVWVGIYGTQKGQTFIYKTHEANIERLMQMPDIVLPGSTKIQKSFWDYLFCRAGKEVVDKEEVRIKMGITPEQGEEWRRELLAWREKGTPPTSDYMKLVIKKLENEFD